MSQFNLSVAENLHIYKNYIDSVDVDSSGKRLVVGYSSLEGNTWDGGISLQSTDGAEACSRYSPSGISMVRFSGSNLILAARDDGTVAIYSLDKLDEVQVFNAHDDVVSCVVDNPHNESQFASCSWDGSIHLWDWQSKAKPVSSYIRAHQGHVNGVAYSHSDPNSFASVGWDGNVRLWDKRENPSSGCSGVINVNQISSCVSYESTDSNVLLVGSDAGEIIVTDLRGGKISSSIVCRSRVHKGRIRRILASPVARPGLFISASDDTTYAICSRIQNKIVDRIRFSQHSDCVTDVAWVTCTSFSKSGEKKIDRLKDIVYSVSTDKSVLKNAVDLSHFSSSVQ